jgi:hypothetical protein
LPNYYAPELIVTGRFLPSPYIANTYADLAGVPTYKNWYQDEELNLVYTEEWPVLQFAVQSASTVDGEMKPAGLYERASESSPWVFVNDCWKRSDGEILQSIDLVFSNVTPIPCQSTGYWSGNFDENCGLPGPEEYCHSAFIGWQERFFENIPTIKHLLWDQWGGGMGTGTGGYYPFETPPPYDPCPYDYCPPPTPQSGCCLGNYGYINRQGYSDVADFWSTAPFASPEYNYELPIGHLDYWHFSSSGYYGANFECEEGCYSFPICDSSIANFSLTTTFNKIPFPTS